MPLRMTQGTTIVNESQKKKKKLRKKVNRNKQLIQTEKPY